MESAIELGIEPWRVGRLGRFLKVNRSERIIAQQDLGRPRGAGDPEERYFALVQWTLERLRCAGS